MKITKRLLQKHEACTPQVEIFATKWPNDIEVTLTSLTEARAIGLDVFWLERLIPADKRAEYEAKRKPLWDEYHTKREPLQVEHEAKRGSLWDEYHAKGEPQWAEYDAKRIKILMIALSE